MVDPQSRFHVIIYYTHTIYMSEKKNVAQCINENSTAQQKKLYKFTI